jgi:hypothetical protein
MRHVRIGGLEFSKAVCGTNAFYGRSHFSAARDAEYCARFDDETIGHAIRRCLEAGINTVESSANERITAILSSIRQASGRPMHFIGSTRIDETSPMKTHQQKLDHLLATGAQICVIHSQFVDRPGGGESVRGLERWLDKIHAAGLLTGVSTHRISTVELCERKRYAIDAYMFPLNITGYVYPGYDGVETPAERVTLIRNTPKPFILMKTLAAGRIPPSEGLAFVAENSKAEDIISIGFGSVDEVSETVGLFERYFL